MGRETEKAAKSGEVSKTFTAGEWAVELELFAGGKSAEIWLRALSGRRSSEVA